MLGQYTGIEQDLSTLGFRATAVCCQTCWSSRQQVAGCDGAVHRQVVARDSQMIGAKKNPTIKRKSVYG